MKKTIKAILAVTLALVITAALFSGCGSQNGQQTPSGTTASTGTTPATGNLTLDIVHQYPPEQNANSHDGTIWNEMTDKYIADHPDVKFNVTAIDQADLHVKIQAQAAADDLPDVFFLKGSWVSNFVSNDLLLDFTPYLEKSSTKDAYKPATFEPFTRNGKLYGMPVQFASTSFVYYNADLWKSIGYDTFPTDWNEIKAAAKKFNDKGIVPFAAGNKDKWFFESCWLSALGDRFTGTEWTRNMIENNGKAKFTDPDFVSALQFLQDLAKAKLFNADFNSITNTQSISIYAEGKAAATVDGYWAIASILNQASDETIKATKMTVLPAVPNGKGNAAMTSGGGGWAVTASDELQGAQRDLAADYCLYITGPEYSTKLAQNYGEIGACNVEGVDMSKFDQLTQDYVALVNKTDFTPIYDIQMDGAVIEVMNTAMQEMLNGSKTARQVAEEIQAEQDKLAK